MITSPHYYSIRNKEVLYYIRLHMVHHATTYSLRDTERAFSVARNTVRTWARRYDEDPHAKRYDRRPSTTTHPYRMDTPWEETFVARGKERRWKGMSAIVAQLQRRYRIPYSVPTLIKCVRRNNLYRGRHTTQLQKQDMYHVTRILRFSARLPVDIK